MNWILVIYIYAGALASGDSVSLLQINKPFSSQQSCDEAGKAASTLVRASAKEYRYVCMPHKG